MWNNKWIRSTFSIAVNLKWSNLCIGFFFPLFILFVCVYSVFFLSEYIESVEKFSCFSDLATQLQHRMYWILWNQRMRTRIVGENRYAKKVQIFQIHFGTTKFFAANTTINRLYLLGWLSWFSISIPRKTKRRTNSVAAALV